MPESTIGAWNRAANTTLPGASGDVATSSPNGKPPEIRTMRSRVRALFAVSLVCGAAPLAASTIQVSNLGANDSFSASISASNVSNQVLAGKFTTDASSYVLEGAQALLRNCCSTSFGLATYEARIYSDTGSLPDNLLYTFTDTPTLAVGGGPTTVGFATNAGFVLQASTSYWLAIRNTTGGIITWRTTADDAEFSPGAWTIDDTGLARSTTTGASWGNYFSTPPSTSYVPMFSILTAGVPEPASAALLAAGLALLGGMHRRGIRGRTA